MAFKCISSTLLHFNYKYLTLICVFQLYVTNFLKVGKPISLIGNTGKGTFKIRIHWTSEIMEPHFKIKTLIKYCPNPFTWLQLFSLLSVLFKSYLLFWSVYTTFILFFSNFLNVTFSENGTASSPPNLNEIRTYDYSFRKHHAETEGDVYPTYRTLILIWSLSQS